MFPDPSSRLMCSNKRMSSLGERNKEATVLFNASASLYKVTPFQPRSATAVIK